MTDEELTAIEEVISRAQQSSGMAAGNDVAMIHAPALLAEVCSLRAERDALRKNAERLREAIDKFLSFQGSTREPDGQAALDAALAVQP